MNQTPDQLQANLMADTVAFPVLSAAELAECTERAIPRPYQGPFGCRS
jgi:hypothetical protein